MAKNRSVEYVAWLAMKARCYAPCNNGTTYQDKGLTVCEEWKHDFSKFLSDMGKRPSSKHSIDRIDNDKGYSKENCRWATMKTQCSNRGSFNKVFEYGGQTMVLKEWSRVLGIKYTTLYLRITRSGLSFEDAIKEDPFSRMITIDSETMILKDWCIKLGRKYSTVVNRIHDGMDIIKAIKLETPK